MKLTTNDKLVLRKMLAVACKHDEANTAEFERVLAKIVPLGPVANYEEARVDLGAAQNGRVAWRKIFRRRDGVHYIVVNSRHVPVMRVAYGSHAHIHYVTVPQ